MKCPRCGTKLKNEKNPFCMRCGYIKNDLDNKYIKKHFRPNEKIIIPIFLTGIIITLIMFIVNDQNDRIKNIKTLRRNIESTSLYTTNNIAYNNILSPIEQEAYNTIIKAINNYENKTKVVLDNYDRQYYKETKILEIGSSTMSAPNRAINITLTENVNGSKTLTFSMYYKYIDNESGELVENPWINLLTNERKLKLWYGDDPNNKKPEEWYDFLIKNVNESSEEHLYTYTANDYFINELSKIGYDVVLNTELENSTGTITDLAETILKNTD